jgi:ELWxxDGT repeat protein
MTTFRAVMAGLDASGHVNLWVTNGTAVGTSELTVAGASASGLNPYGFHVFGGTLLFEGTDSSGRVNLWVTDGTSAGTKEVAAAGAYSKGLLYDYPAEDADFTVFGNKTLLVGEDASGRQNLWVTDGTSAGTSELTVASAYSGGLFDRNNQPSGYEFAALGNKALFSGADTNGHFSLWMTDGTSTGTSELTVAGAYSGGLDWIPPSSPSLATRRCSKASMRATILICG